LASDGPGGAECKLAGDQVARLQVELQAGAVAHGWPDQRWTLARVAALIEEKFRVRYTLAGVDYLLHRLGWSVQVPTRRAVERDEARIAGWRQQQWPAIKGWRRTWAPGSVSRTKPARV
jgi:transposase